jgi:CMP-N,N'-diacetyllegionaminic acid synthase
VKHNKIFIIPARKGSKCLPGKNVKVLGDKPLIAYSIEFAKLVCAQDDTICVTTDDKEVIKIANELGIATPFLRPDDLSTDSANTYQVIRHAIEFYKSIGKTFDTIVLLQPTSPFRLMTDFVEMEKIYFSKNPDMVVSVKLSKESPYFTLFEEDANGFLNKFIDDKLSNYRQRQDCPPVYTYNGSIYMVNCKSFIEKGTFDFDHKLKYVMPDSRSIDIDTQADWVLTEFYLNVSNENSTGNSKVRH